LPATRVHASQKRDIAHQRPNWLGFYRCLTCCYPYNCYINFLRRLDLFDILLAEDNPADELLIKLALEEHHVPNKLHIVRDGSQALSFMDGIGKPGHPHSIGLILLDIDLSSVKALRIVSKCRKRTWPTRTLLIVITSSDSPKDRRRMAELGIDGYFLKPCELGTYMNLGDMVRNVIEAKPTPTLTRMAAG
jgi:CheY-like chemotaxis protein